MRWSSGRCWTLRLKLLRCTDPTASAFMPTALRSITSALVLKSGGRRLIAVCTFILMTGNGCSTLLIVLFLAVSFGGLSCGWAKGSEIFHGCFTLGVPLGTEKGQLRLFY